ncbi:unnamed protein product [Hermetia illucens]|uniref:Sperm microtubule inner protein 1 C-terminal domain-containing protein n=1 Tax=Hermetia illucens TaxID=343691 RepID=A0A7R8UDD4_HERIL|nr:uncharacterized protein LOC119647216 [Hermetia illucens]CAD7078715.1 unnamed protein product [Hermetia illucens]
MNSRRTKHTSKGNSVVPWKNPFHSVISAGPKRRGSSYDFASYDLAKGEDYKLDTKTAMKEVPPMQKDILKDGPRMKYLNIRWEITPDVKYYFPEATSWRYGWMHNVMRRSTLPT